MKRSALLISLCLLMVGCSFFHWLGTDTNGGPPAIKALEEGAKGGLSAFEQGGILAGVAGFVLTTTKTLLRLWNSRNAIGSDVVVEK